MKPLRPNLPAATLLLGLVLLSPAPAPAETWLQLKFDGRAFYTCHAGGLQASLVSAWADLAAGVFP